MYSKAIKYWLIIGCVLLFFQVIIGGITRITGSGLSITKWEIVTGTLPPTSEQAWEVEFDKYKTTPQYEQINVGMSMGEFKFIYFWEYFHRLWARMMGFVFLIGAVVFSLRKQLDWPLWKRLFPVIGFAMLAAVFGWIMVASGLVHRPWVNAYKLSIHLAIAFITFGFLVNATLFAFNKHDIVGRPTTLFKVTGVLLAIQILFGGVMSGMKAGLIFPTWPDMYGEYLPSILLDSASWKLVNLEFYEQSAFAPALVQFLHRSTAYGLAALVVYLLYRVYKSEDATLIQRNGVSLFAGLLLLQVIVGILTVINCIGSIPLGLGVLHQAIALLLVGSYVAMIFYMKLSPREKLD